MGNPGLTTGLSQSDARTNLTQLREHPVQPSTSLSKKADMDIEEIIRGMLDLQIKLARLEENTSINNSKNVSKQGYVQRCIWCDDASHTRKDCNEFNMIRQGIICWKDGKIALKDREDLLQTNFGKGGMRALVQDYLKEHEIVVRESASYGARVDDEIGGSTEISEFWASVVSTMQEGKIPREALLRTAATIRGRTGNFDDTREGNSFKRQTRGDKAREAASQELPIKDTSASLGEKTTETKDKGKSIAYKLLSDIEVATNLKGVLEERILNAKVEFTLKEVLGIAKKEFHDVIIDSIKRKRQLMSKTGMIHAIDARICRDEEEVDVGYKQPTNEKNGYNQRVRFEDTSDKEMETLSHYTRKHWARATTEVLVKVGDIEEPIVALVDHSSEINLMSKDLYKKQKWPIDMEHGWAIRAANNTRGELYGACPDVKIRIGDVATEQHFFVQDTTSYPLILGQPYITATRMETKVLGDGSAYTRVRSEDGRKAVQFLTVPPNHERNRDRLREKPLPKIVEGFKDFGEEVLSRDEGAFDASFIGILENGNIMYKKVDDFKRKERKRLYDIEGQLRKIDNDKIVEIHSREVYTMLESFQAPEVTVETRYKTADKKVKPIVGSLLEDSKEQMGEASKEASLRDPMSIGHQFTKETFEELKIGSDGFLLPEEITCFKKMLAKQGRSFAFEPYEISYLEYWEHQPTPVQILSGQVQSLRYSQPKHTEMLHSILITGVSKKRRTNSHDGFEEPIGSNFDNPIRVLLSNMRPELAGQPNAVYLREIQVTTGIFSNIGPELVGRLNVVPITGFDSVLGCLILCAISGNVVFGKWILKGKNVGESLTTRANFGSKLEVGANSGAKTED
uniref:Predicted protein n=1 Tax=Physcomitrium patens TaxID=3218 RepID=A9TMF8_PHYPA